LDQRNSTAASANLQLSAFARPLGTRPVEEAWLRERSFAADNLLEFWHESMFERCAHPLFAPLRKGNDIDDVPQFRLCQFNYALVMSK